MKIALIYDRDTENPTFCLDDNFRCVYLAKKLDSCGTRYWCTVYDCGFRDDIHRGVRRLKKCRDAEVNDLQRKKDEE